MLKMFWLRKKRRDSAHQDQDRRSDEEKADTKVKPKSPGTKPSHTMSSKRKASKTSPRSSEKSASSEPRSPCNNGPVSCLQAISSATPSVTAELAATSKIPHREKSPLASSCNKEHHGNVKLSELHGFTNWEEKKQTPQSQEVLKSQIRDILNRYEHRKEFLGATTTFPHVPRCEYVPPVCRAPESSSSSLLSSSLSPSSLLSSSLSPSSLLSSSLSPSSLSSSSLSESSLSESSLSESSLSESSLSKSSLSKSSLLKSSSSSSSDDDLLDSLLVKYREALNPLMVSRSGTAPGRIFPSPHSPETLISHFSTSTVSPSGHDEYILSPPLEQTRRHRNSGLSSDCPTRTSFCLNQSPLANIEEDLSATDTLKSSTEACRLSTSGLPDNSNVDDMTCRYITEATRIADRLKKAWLLGLDEISEAEEEDQCRICREGADGSPTNPLISPCLCSGSARFIHIDCLKACIKAKVEMGTGPYTIRICEVCQGKLKVDIRTLNFDEYYREHRVNSDVIFGGITVNRIGIWQSIFRRFRRND